MVPIKDLLTGAETHRRKTGRPLVILSYAQSLDGGIAARRDTPLLLSSAAAMEMTHQLRAAHDGILVGIGTLLADDPRLNVRLAQGRDPQPVVLDSRLRFPLDAALLRGSRPAWIACLPGVDPQKRVELEQRGATVLSLPEGEDGRVSLPDLLSCLGEKGLSSLMVEGGAGVITSFLAQGLADRLVLTVAPLIIGGLRAVHPEAALSSQPRLENPGYERLGDDLIVWGALSYR